LPALEALNRRNVLLSAQQLEKLIEVLNVKSRGVDPGDKDLKIFANVVE
jgi:hypothetical protein